MKAISVADIFDQLYSCGRLSNGIVMVAITSRFNFILEEQNVQENCAVVVQIIFCAKLKLCMSATETEFILTLCERFLDSKSFMFLKNLESFLLLRKRANIRFID